MKSGIIRQIIRKLLDNLNMQSKLLVNGERTNTVTCLFMSKNNIC